MTLRNNFYVRGNFQNLFTSKVIIFKGVIKLRFVGERFLTLMSLNILPILKTLTTLRRVGETGKSSIMSSMTMPTMEAITRTKSNKFQAVVK